MRRPSKTAQRAAVCLLLVTPPGLRGQGANAGAAVVLDALATHLDAGDVVSARAELRALAALRRGDQPVFERLLEALGQAPGELRVHVLRALGDLVLWADDAAAARVEEWLATVPPSRIAMRVETMVARHQGRFAPMMELERVRARLALRAVEDVPGLVLALAEANLDRVEAAAERLAQQPERAASALPALTPLLELAPPQHMVSFRVMGAASVAELARLPTDTPLAAARAVVAVAPRSAAAAAAHARILAKGGEDERLQSALALRGFATLSAAACDGLVALVEQREHAALRREALLTLAAVGCDGAAVRGVLAAVADGDDPQLAAVARAALDRGPDR